MKSSPFAGLIFDIWNFENAVSSVEADGTFYNIEWFPGTEAGCFHAENALGIWSLKVCHQGRKTVVSSGVTLNAPVRHLKYSMMQCSRLPLEHIVCGGMKMGKCSIRRAPVAETEDFESFYNCILSNKNTSLVLTHPLAQSQMAEFCGKLDGDKMSLDVVYLMDNCSAMQIEFPATGFEIGSPFEILRQYAEENTEVKREFSAPEPGWNSWDYYRWTVSEDEVLKNAEFIARDPVLSKHVKRIIVDDGWQYCYGEWHANHLFPSGMRHLAAEIRKMGFVPGLWVAPSAVEPHARIAQLEYDMLACSEGGQPCLAFQCMRRYGFILDPTVEKSRKFLRELFDRLTNDGFGYFKLDFLASTLDAAQFADKSVPRSQIIRRLMEPICEGVDGRAAILGCNYPFMTGNRYVDAARVGSDIHATWEGAKVNAVNVTYRFWMNKKLWINDPDFSLCRGVETSPVPDSLQPCLVFCQPESGYQAFFSKTFASAKECELEVLLSVALMSGGAINLSDDLTLLNAAGLDLARKVVSAESGEAALPLDLFRSGIPALWQQKLSRGGRALVVNWADEPQEFRLDFKDLPARAVDFWRGKEIAVPREIVLTPHSCLLLEY